MAEFSDDANLDVKRLLSEICTYYKHAPTDMEADLWMITVREFGAGPVKRALMDHVGRSEFMPKIGEIRTALGAAGTGNSFAAFEQVRLLVERVGPYLSPQFDDPAIGLAILDMGGWVYINETMPCPVNARFDYESMAKRFAVAYEAARARLTRGDAQPVALRGIHYTMREADRQRALLAASTSVREIAR